jgi:hypothetical protein
MLPNLKCGGVVVNDFRVMRGRKRGSFASGTESSNRAPSSGESFGNLTINRELAGARAGQQASARANASG